MVFSVINLSIILYTLPTSSGFWFGYGFPGPSMGLALTGRCSPQSHRYYAPGDSLPCRLYATRIILAIYSIMMIIAPSQIITIINKSHHEINSIIRFLLPARRILRAQADPSAATDLTVTIPLKA
ncbi:putative membrane protein [Salmonella enterica subsp. enterica serovar Paratyphi A]|nr:putative membrane protein [Salmonella enterica subsp. enterica serovar Paratyphi A]